MKRYSKKLVISLIMIVILSTLSGCGNSEKAVFKGLSNQTKIMTQETETQMTFKIDASGLSDDQQKYAADIIALANEATLSIHRKTIVSEDGSDLKSEISYCIEGPETNYPIKYYLDKGLENGVSHARIIIDEDPAIWELTPQLKDKDYLVTGLKLMKGENGSSLAEFIITEPERRQALLDAGIAFEGLNSYDEEMVTYKGSKRISGQGINSYNISMNDETFKQWLKSAGATIGADSYLRGFATTYLINMKEQIDGLQTPGIRLISETPLSEKIPNKMENAEAVNEFFERLGSNPLLGERGLNVDLEIDDNGNILNMSGAIDFVYNQKAWSKTKEGNAIIECVIQFSHKILSSNSKMGIILPEITDENSFDLADYGIDSDKNAKICLNNNRVYYDVNPVIENGRTMVPIRETAEMLDFEVNWDSAERKVTVEKEGTIIVLFLDNKTAYVNGVASELDVPAKIINGRTLIPLRFLGEKLNLTVNWDQASKKVLLTTNNMEK